MYSFAIYYLSIWYEDPSSPGRWVSYVLCCRSPVIGTIGRHCTSTSRIARTLALRSAHPSKRFRCSRLPRSRRAVGSQRAYLCLVRGVRWGEGTLQAGRKSRGVSFHAGPPSPPQAPRTSLSTAGYAARLSRRVYISIVTWEVDILVVKVTLNIKCCSIHGFETVSVLSVRNILKKLRPKWSSSTTTWGTFSLYKCYIILNKFP